MFAKDLAELSGRGTAATNLEIWSIMESINLFLLVDMEIGERGLPALNLPFLCASIWRTLSRKLRYHPPVGPVKTFADITN